MNRWVVAIAILAVPLLPAPAGVAAEEDLVFVELRRWSQPGLFPVQNAVFELAPSEAYEEYYFKVNPAGDQITDVAVGVMRVRIVSTAIPVCVGFAADTGETNDKYQICEGLRTETSYNLDFWVQSPSVTLSLYGMS